MSPKTALVKACYPLLGEISLDKFKLTLLPALQKAMLRNPEVILETVGIILFGLKVDLSTCAMDIGSSLISMLLKTITLNFHYKFVLTCSQPTFKR